MLTSELRLPSTLVFEMGSQLNLGLTVLARLAGKESSRDMPICAPSTGVTGSRDHPWLLDVGWGSELMSSCCAASTLLTQPSPLPHGS